MFSLNLLFTDLIDFFDLVDAALRRLTVKTIVNNRRIRGRLSN